MRAELFGGGFRIITVGVGSADGKGCQDEC